MENLIVEYIKDYGLIMIALLLILESVCPFIPSEPILLFTGFLVYKGTYSFEITMIVTLIGCVVCAVIMYYMGKFMIKLKWLKENKKINNAKTWFKKHGEKSIFFCRFVPFARTAISIPAGMFNMKISHFIFLSALGSLIWNFVFIYAGYSLKDNWTYLLQLIDQNKYLHCSNFSCISSYLFK